jgi:hypothetical protein
MRLLIFRTLYFLAIGYPIGRPPNPLVGPNGVPNGMYRFRFLFLHP